MLGKNRLAISVAKYPSPEPVRKPKDWSFLANLEDVTPPFEDVEVEYEKTKAVSEPLTEERRAELLKERNEFISRECPNELQERWPEKLPVVRCDLDRAEAKPTFGNVDNIDDIIARHRAVKLCLDDTVGAMAERYALVAGQQFDYLELQKALQVQQKEEDLKYLEQNVFEDQPTLKAVPSTQILAKEFQEIFGPTKFREPMEKDPYIVNYTQYREEAVAKLNSKLTSLQETARDAGREEVLKILENFREEIDTLKETLRGGNKEVYDLNPYTNAAHLDWFLLPRPPIPHASNCFIRHPSLEMLEEYKIPEKLQGKLLVLDGYWPSLTDYNIIDFCKTPIPRDPVKQLHDRTTEKRANFWTHLGTKIIQEIGKFPLGVEMHEFFCIVEKKCNFMQGTILFPGMKFEEVVRDCLQDIIFSVPIPSVEDPAITILYPAYMRGVIEDGSSLFEAFHRIWSQIIFIVKKRGGEVLVTNLEGLYKKYFMMPAKWELYGFKSKLQFLELCIMKWNGEEDYKVELVGRGVNSILKKIN